ncbi:MAG: hypothetical protein IPN32_01340 [Deltaproteobacteria bacterium]|nr:hypothetical protein [Deltaproteobacteria bacterium]
MPNASVSACSRPYSSRVDAIATTTPAPIGSSASASRHVRPRPSHRHSSTPTLEPTDSHCSSRLIERSATTAKRCTALRSMTAS